MKKAHFGIERGPTTVEDPLYNYNIKKIEFPLHFGDSESMFIRCGSGNYFSTPSKVVMEGDRNNGDALKGHIRSMGLSSSIILMKHMTS